MSYKIYYALLEVVAETREILDNCGQGDISDKEILKIAIEKYYQKTGNLVLIPGEIDSSYEPI